MTTPFSGLPQKQSQSRRTTRARMGFYTAGAAASPKKPTSPRERGFSGVTDTPKECDCQRKRREKQEAADRERKHRDTVEELKRRGFSNTAMRQWTFEDLKKKKPNHFVVRQYAKFKLAADFRFMYGA